VVIEFDIAAPRPTVWEYFVMPGQRPKWRGADEVREMSKSGTHIEIRVAKPKPKDQAFLDQVGPEFQKNITNEVATLRRMLEGQQTAASLEEAALPLSGERFLTQPVHAR
jgi:hypothetical protein